MYIYLICFKHLDNKVLAHKLTKRNVRISMARIEEDMNIDIKRLLNHYTNPVGVVHDGACDNTERVVRQVSKYTLGKYTGNLFVF